MPQPIAILFYDGSCALCHWWVNFVLKRENTGKLAFAPLQGETFRTQVQRPDLPDSLILQTEGGELYTRSAAVLRILEMIGGPWKIVGGVMRVIPGPLRDVLYNFVAKVRYKLFGRKEEMCPLVAPELAQRFLP